MFSDRKLRRDTCVSSWTDRAHEHTVLPYTGSREKPATALRGTQGLFLIHLLRTESARVRGLSFTEESATKASAEMPPPPNCINKRNIYTILYAIDLGNFG